MKSISITNPDITENMECTIVKARAPVIDILKNDLKVNDVKVGVSP